MSYINLNKVFRIFLVIVRSLLITFGIIILSSLLIPSLLTISAYSLIFTGLVIIIGVFAFSIYENFLKKKKLIVNQYLT